MTTAEATTAARRSRPGVGRLRFLREPVGKPRFLRCSPGSTSSGRSLPFVIAVQFSFNSGRSRSTFQGFSSSGTRAISISLGAVDDTSLHGAPAEPEARRSLTMPIATALGVGLAIGLARWRGRGAGAANFLMLFPLVTPEIVIGVALFLVFTHLFTFVPAGHHRPAPRTRHVLAVLRRHRDEGPALLDRSRVRGGRRWTSARRRAEALRRVLLPLLAPAILVELLHRVRDLDRRLRHQPVPLRTAGAHQSPIKHLQRGAHVGEPGSERAGATMMLLLDARSRRPCWDPPALQPAARGRALGRRVIRPLRRSEPAIDRRRAEMR